MIRVLFTIRSNQFEAYSAIESRLDLVDENDKHTHKLEYLHLCDPETILGKVSIQFNQIFEFYFYLDEFKYDEEYEVNQNKYEEIAQTILDENSDDEDESSSNSLENDNDQSNISVADTNISSSGSSVADKEN
jgi:pre-mRNA-splicing factor CWC22